MSDHRSKVSIGSASSLSSAPSTLSDFQLDGAGDRRGPPGKKTQKPAQRWSERNNEDVKELDSIEAVPSSSRNSRKRLLSDRVDDDKTSGKHLSPVPARKRTKRPSKRWEPESVLTNEKSPLVDLELRVSHM